MSEIGPVEYLIVAFPGNKFRGEIAPALADLVEAGTIRIMDIAFVGKDEDGTVAAFELADIDPDVREGLENLGCSHPGCSRKRTWRRPPRSSSRTPLPHFSSGRTSGPARSHRRCETRAGSSSTSAASRTKSSRLHATMPRQTPSGGDSDAPYAQRTRTIGTAARTGVAMGVAGGSGIASNRSGPRGAGPVRRAGTAASRRRRPPPRLTTPPSSRSSQSSATTA